MRTISRTIAIFFIIFLCYLNIMLLGCYMLIHENVGPEFHKHRMELMYEDSTKEVFYCAAGNCDRLDTVQIIAGKKFIPTAKH